MQQMVSILQILLLAQHVSGTIMPIIRSSRVLYRWLLPVVFRAATCIIFELLMMGIMVPETCWASNNIAIKKPSVASSWHFISTDMIVWGLPFFLPPPLLQQRQFTRFSFCGVEEVILQIVGIGMGALCDFWLPPRSRWKLRSSGSLLSEWW